MIKKNNWKILLNSFYLGIKEWKLLIGMIIIGFLNLYSFAESLYSTFLPVKICYIITQFILLVGYFLLLGRLCRRVYKKEKMGILSLVKRSFFSGLVFFIFVVIWYAFIIAIGKITQNFWIHFIFHILYLLLVTSVILECIKVFFLDKDVFSLYSVFSRMADKNYLFGYAITIVLAFVLYFFSEGLMNLLVSITSNIFSIKFIYYLLNGILFGYISLVIILFFFQVIDLD